MSAGKLGSLNRVTKIKTQAELEFESELLAKIEVIPLLSYNIAKKEAESLRNEEKYKNTIWTTRAFSKRWWSTYCRSYGFKYVERRGKVGAYTGGWVKTAKNTESLQARLSRNVKKIEGISNPSNFGPLYVPQQTTPHHTLQVAELNSRKYILQTRTLPQ